MPPKNNSQRLSFLDSSPSRYMNTGNGNDQIDSQTLNSNGNPSRSVIQTPAPTDSSAIVINQDAGYPDVDAELISLLNIGSNSNNSTGNHSKPLRRSTPTTSNLNTNVTNSRQPSIPTLPIHNMNRQLENIKFPFESPNFDSFITFTPNHQQIITGPGNSTCKSNSATSSKFPHPFVSKNSQYLPTDNFLLFSPNINTPIANKSNVEDFFDTPYINSLYSNFANTTNNDDPTLRTTLSYINSTNPTMTLSKNGAMTLRAEEAISQTFSSQQMQVLSNQMPDIAFTQTPITDKLNKLLKTPTSNDIFASKNFFGNSTIKKLTNSILNSSVYNSSAPKSLNSQLREEDKDEDEIDGEHEADMRINDQEHEKDEEEQDQEQEHDGDIMSSKVFGILKNSPCVKHKQHELLQQVKLLNETKNKSIASEMLENELNNELLRIRTNFNVLNTSKTATSTPSKIPPQSAQLARDLSIQPSKNNKRIRNVTNETEKAKSEPITSRRSTRNRKPAMKSIPNLGNAPLTVSNSSTVNFTPCETIIESHPLKPTTLRPIAPMNDHDVINHTIDSSPSTIVVSSASKSITRLPISVDTKQIDASPTPMNKQINKLASTGNINATIDSNIDDALKVPVMGVFKEHSNSLRRFNTQPLQASNRKTRINRSTSMNDTLGKGNGNGNVGDGQRNAILSGTSLKGLQSTFPTNAATPIAPKGKGKKRGRNGAGCGMLHIIMADPDQLKGNKKRKKKATARERHELDGPAKTAKDVENNININMAKMAQLNRIGEDGKPMPLIPLSNSTNVTNNRMKSSPIKAINVTKITDEKAGRTNIRCKSSTENVFRE